MAQALGEDLVQPPELQDDSSSLGSDSELSGPGPYRQADRYGFIGGSSAEPGPGHPPADLIRQREMKWVEMTLHWEKTMSRRYKKVKMQCRKGIPSALRARCWPLLCGAHVCQKNSPGTYQELAEAPGDPQWMETIGRDLHRQFPLHEMFVSPQGHGKGSCRCSRPTPCIDRSRATARPRGLWLLCCSCTCPRRRPSGAWCRSVRSTSPATTGPTWCQGTVPCGADIGAPGAGHCRATRGLPWPPGDTRSPSSHPPRTAAGGGLHVTGAQRGAVRAGPAAGDQGPAGPAARFCAGAPAPATGPPRWGPSHLRGPAAGRGTTRRQA
ncbi:carabin isoform X2 [Theropithecus gelada]|nr:carabin isoform X2 [Theropithecus gelada]